MEVSDLGGSWSIASTDGEYRLQATMPGSLFAELESRGEFGERGISYRENNRRCLEVADREFVFTREFELPPSWRREGRKLFIEADGLDTLATLYLNGAEIGRAANMHRRFRFELRPSLLEERNRLEIRFGNALQHCRDEWPRRSLWHAYDTSPDIAFPGFNAIRKSHCSFGWDWGPIVPDVGIWRGIRLVAYEGIALAEPRIVQHHSGQDGNRSVALEIRAEFERFDDEALQWSATLIDPQGRSRPIALDAEGVGEILVADPELWWPNGLGAQALYRLELAALRDGRCLQARSVSLGLRSLSVRRERDSWGESFEFVVNGLSFFARGADWIPEDLALARVGRDRTERLIADAAQANFNCLRVWGGGVYPSDDFYDLCDRYGLVVWQDLMYACALYDVADPSFRENMVEEVRDNLRRIRYHASLGLICGNNEMEWGFVEWGLDKAPAASKSEYLLQYQELFPSIVKELCPDVFYWPASPSSGGDFDDPNSPDRGDCHFWAVWHGNQDYAEYRRHYFRFMSEFGFESFPSMKTIESFTLPEDRNVFSPVMEDHQRCVGGNAKILAYAAKYFRAPGDLGQAVYLSQVSQVEAQRAGIEHWRRNRGRCMGSIYWQLNDNWPVASWASIDSEGRWKLLHYAVKKAYAPLLLSSFVKDTPVRTAAERRGLALPATSGHYDAPPAVVELHLSNENAAPVAGRLSWELVSLDGEELRSGQSAIEAGAFSSALAETLDFQDLVQGRELPRNAVLAYRAIMAGGEILDGFQVFLPYKALDIRKPRISIEPILGEAMDGASSGRRLVKLSSDRPAFFVTLEHPELDLIFSDNGFFLDGRHPLIVEIVAARNGREKLKAIPEGIEASLAVSSLADAFAR
jgi:Beta-galactosidase/beta-glucuronidase